MNFQCQIIEGHCGERMEPSAMDGCQLIVENAIRVQNVVSAIENFKKSLKPVHASRVSQKKWCIAISNSRVVLDDQRLIKLTDT